MCVRECVSACGDIRWEMGVGVVVVVETGDGDECVG